MATPLEVLKSKVGILADPIAEYVAAILAHYSGIVVPPDASGNPPVDGSGTPELPPVVTPPVETPPTLPTIADTDTVYQIVDYSGGNFVKGINVKDNAVLLRPAQAVKAGLKLRFKNGQGSIIVGNESIVIAGVTLAKVVVGAITLTEALGAPGSVTLYGMATAPTPEQPSTDPTPTPNPQPPVDASGVYQLGGVNISGLGSNPWVKNAELNTHWRFPSRNFIEAFANKGIKTFRNPVAIEKFNSAVPQGPLDQAYIDTLGRYLDVLSEFDAMCDFEFHNYNRAFVVVDEVDGNQYTGVDSGDANTRNAARAFWAGRGKYFPNQFSYAVHYHRKDNKTRLSEWRIIGKAGSRATTGFYDAADQAYLLSQIVPIFKSHKSLQGWGLMNEPFGVDDLMIPNYQLWIDEIRKHDKEKLLYVCGNFYASATSWATSSKGFENLVDPSNKLIYEAHTYPDGNGGGGGKWNNRFEQIPENKIIEQVTPFHDWCVRFGKKGRIGEVGGPKDNPYYIKALENFLNKAQEWNMQVMLWAGGPGWPSDNVTTVQYDVGPGDTKTIPELYANLNPLVNRSSVILTSHKIK